MYRFTTLLAFVLLLASFPTSSQAQDTKFTFNPPAPRSTDVVTIGASFLSSCFTGTGRAEVADKAVHLTAYEGCVCPAVLPSRVEAATTVGPLAAGSYEVDLVIAPDPRDPKCRFAPVDRGNAPLRVRGGGMKVRVLPAAPTTAAAVRVRVITSCPSAFALPSRDGNVIRVDEVPSLILAPCTEKPSWRTDLFLGKLPAGNYSLIFFGLGQESPAVTHVESFRVRRAPSD